MRRQQDDEEFLEEVFWPFFEMLAKVGIFVLAAGVGVAVAGLLVWLGSWCCE